MIGYNRLGVNGRLGNQMFEYAALRGIAAKHGYDWCIPPKDRETNHMADYNIFEGFKLPHLKNFGYVNGPTLNEPTFDFDQNTFENCPDNVNIDGFRQSEKYFKHIEDEIREDFEFVDDIYGPCKEFVDQHGDMMFLHVRRADATGRPHQFPVASIRWYERILEEHFPKDKPVLILTDKLDWIEEQELFKQDRFLVSEHREYSSNTVWNGRGKLEYTLSPWVDLCLMSLCNGAIVPNTTFGWWGAWLQKSKNKKIVCQFPYFGSQFTDKCSSYKYLKDFYPEGWIRGNLNGDIDTKYTPAVNEID